jgi:hypothetical protein
LKKTTTELYKQHRIPGDLMRRIPFAVCHTCSGMTKKNGKPAYRFYNSFSELKEHCARVAYKDIEANKVAVRGNDYMIKQACIINVDVESSE